MNTDFKPKIKLTRRVIRNNPYWSKPYLVRVIMHWLGRAPYQLERKGANNNG